jgi:hypothetical protein
VQEDIMENEALGGSLDESAASELLTLGLKSAEGIASSTDGLDDEAAELSMADRLKALRKLMRHLGRLLGEWNELDADGRLWLWNSVQKHARSLYGEGVQLPTLDELMGSLSQGESPGKIIANLREALDSQMKS